MADVAVDSVVDSNSNERVMHSASMVWLSPDEAYVPYCETGADLEWRKITDFTGTPSYGTPADIETAVVRGYATWYDRWTNGNTGQLFHIFHLEETTDDVHYTTIDYGNSDTQSSKSQVINGSSFTSSQTAISTCVSRGGRIYMAYNGDGGTEAGFGYWNGSWNSLSSPWESTYDSLILMPGAETDTDDIIAVYMDRSSGELTIKTYDQSLNSWSEGSAFVTGATWTSNWQHMSAAPRHSDNHTIVAVITEHLSSTGDMRVFDVTNGSSISELTAPWSNSSRYATCGVTVNQQNDDIVIFYSSSGVTGQIQKETSTDGGSTWSGATAHQEDTGDDERSILCTPSIGSDGGQIVALWHNDDTNVLYITETNAVTVTADTGVNATITGVAATATAAGLLGIYGGSASVTGATATATASGLLGFVGTGDSETSVTIRSSWDLAPPRVYLHDGYGNLLAQLAKVRAVSRSYAITGDTSAQFEISDTDADVALVEPNRGLIIRIESVNYPLPWVGYLAGRRRTTPGSYYFTCPARSLDMLLEERYLPVSSTASVYGDVADIIRSLWLVGDVEATTGIALDADLEGGHTIEQDNALSLSGQDVRSMLMTLSRIARVEWWLEHRLVGTKITSTLQMRKHRGDFRGDIELRPGPGGNIPDRPEEWTDLVGAPFRQRVIAGGDEFSSRGTALVQRSSFVGLPEGAELSSIESIHGIAPYESFGGLNPVSSREAAAVIEYVRGSPSASGLAQALAQNAAPVNVGLRVQVAGGEEHHETWQALLPGNVVRVNCGPPVLGSGVNRYARVLAAQPMEDTGAGGNGGFCHVPLELLGEVNDAAA